MTLEQDIELIHQQLRGDEPESLPSADDPASLGSAAIEILKVLYGRPDFLDGVIENSLSEEVQQTVRETLQLTEKLQELMTVDKSGVSFKDKVTKKVREELRSMTRDIYTPSTHVHRRPST